MGKTKLKQALTSILLGFLFGPIFLLVSIAIDIAGISLPLVVNVALSLLLSCSILILVFIAATRKNIALFMAFLFALSALYSAFTIVDLVAIGPKGETKVYVYLKVSYRLGYEWTKSEWDFYKPDCYVESHSLKYTGHSLRISAFDYDYSGNPFHTLPKYIFSKLLCGYSDSETAFKEYREILLERGFSIKDDSNSFKAENETLNVYCKLDGNFIVIAVVDKEEGYLLDQLIVCKSHKVLNYYSQYMVRIVICQ